MRLSPAIRSDRVPSSVALSALFACSLLAGACDTRVDAELLHLEGLSTDSLAPGTSVRIDGRGFPPGHVGEITFDGVTHRPGEAPTAVVARVPTRAHSGARLSFDVTPTLIDDLGGRGTFVGAIRTQFEGSGTSVVSGCLDPFTLVLRPGGAGAMTGALSHERRGRAFLVHLGVRAEAVDGGDGGVLVESIHPTGIAARAGLRKQDRIIGLGPMRVGDVSDLVPGPEAGVAELVLARAGQSQPIRVQVPLVVRDETPTTRAQLGATVASGLGLLLLLLLSPVARITARVARALVAPRSQGDGELLGLADPRRGPSSNAPPAAPASASLLRLRHGLWALVGAAALVVAFGVLPFSARVLPGAVDAGALALVIAALAAAVQASLPTTLSSPRRLGALAYEAMLAVPLLVAVAAVAVGTGTVGVGALARAQGGEPWLWAGLSTPAGLLALPAAMLSALVASNPPPRGATARVLDAVRLFTASSLITVVFLGAWRLPFVEGDPFVGTPLLRALGAALFVAKALAVLVVGVRLRRAFRDPVAVGSLAAVLAVAALAAAAATVVFPTLALPSSFFGPVASLVVAVVALVALAHVARPSAPPTDAVQAALFA